MPDWCLSSQSRIKIPRANLLPRIRPGCTSAACKIIILYCISSFCQIALSIRIFYHSLVDGVFLKHQVIMSTFLNDATIIDNGDAIRIPHRLQSMGYNDSGHLSIDLVTTGFKEMVQSLLHNPFTFTIQCAVVGSDEKGRMLREY